MLIEKVNKINSLWEATLSGKEPAGWPIDTKQVIWEVSAAFCPGVFLEPLRTCAGRAGCVRFHFISLIKANSNLKRTQSTPSVAQTQWTWMTCMSFSISRCHSEPYLLEKEESRRFCSDPWLASDPYKGLWLQSELQLTSRFVKRVVDPGSQAEWLSSPCRIWIVCPLKLLSAHTAHPEEKQLHREEITQTTTRLPGPFARTVINIWSTWKIPLNPRDVLLTYYVWNALDPTDFKVNVYRRNPVNWSASLNQISNWIY